MEKIYGNKISQLNALRSARDILQHEVGSLRLKRVETSIGMDGYLAVSIFGDDFHGAKNYLKWKFGSVINFNELKIGDVRRGHLVSPGNVGFGVFVDIGVFNPKKDALLPLYTLREQLVNEKTFSLPRIVRIYGFLENFPVNVVVISTDKDKGTIEVKLAKSSLELFEKWRHDRLERLICYGASRQEIRRALVKAGALRDIYRIERLGLMEHAIACIFGINAKLLLQRIGPYLPAVSMSVFNTSAIRKIFSTSS
ncbi:MAG: DUF2110 family protein [Candidatus Heimdallarchaeota archaeon]